MLKAPIKEGEEERLEALKEYNILDTLPEMNLDDITRIAAYICDVPIALISLVDEDRQWFKSKVGLGAEQTPRDISFCGHAMYQDEVFIVENALDDERFKDNPLVTGAPNVIFYAGAPLKTRSGYSIGTLCAIDNKPRHLNEEQIKILKALSNHVINYFELSLKTRKLVESQQQIIYAAQMASLGEMASGVAHEINNPMTIIMGRSDLLFSKLNNSDITDKEKFASGELYFKS